MDDLIIAILIVMLSCVSVYIGIRFIKSGKNLLKRKDLNDGESSLEELIFFYSLTIFKSLFGEEKAKGYNRIWYGVMFMIFAIGLLVLLAYIRTMK